ncbi:MAG: hypothetical protein WDA75_08160 [Candidatus Latescibacterota bacterium]|jgi:hypothetical protein
MLPLSQRIRGAAPKLQAWWDHEEQSTPCLLLTGPAPGARPVSVPEDLDRYWFDVDGLVTRAMQGLEGQAWYGAALPYHWPDWGASTFAGVLGAEMEAIDRITFWTRPCCTALEQVREVEVDYEARFGRTVLETTRRSVACSRDHHFVAVYPMVGIADTLAALYGTVPLLTAMVDRPTATKAALRHLTGLWLREFDRICSLIESGGNEGHMTWMAIWAPDRACATQEDFSYMISDAMFREFCLPPLVELVESLPYAMYHLDGAGALSHLDTLLGIHRLRAIQWVPGAGRERVPQWYGLIRRILAAGKSVEVFARPEEIDDLVREVGPRGLLIHCGGVSPDQAARLLERYPQGA